MSFGSPGQKFPLTGMKFEGHQGMSGSTPGSMASNEMVMYYWVESSSECGGRMCVLNACQSLSWAIVVHRNWGHFVFEGLQVRCGWINCRPVSGKCFFFSLLWFLLVPPSSSRSTQAQLPSQVAFASLSALRPMNFYTPACNITCTCKSCLNCK